MVSINPTIKVIENLFDTFNQKFFGNELVRPVLTVSADITGGAYGWCTTFQAWQDGEEGHYEINITAEYLNRSMAEIAGTLIHEMVHLYNLAKGVQDCSRGGTYHNKRFKAEAEKRGLVIECTEKYGWTKTSLQPETLEFVNNLGVIDFKLHRLSGKLTEKKPTKKVASYKYECPVCGQSFTSTKQLTLKCADCDELLEVTKK